MKYLLQKWVSLMSHKFWFLTNVSLRKKIKTKWFLIANIVLCIGILLIINIDSVISFFGGDFNDDINIVMLDETAYKAGDIFKKNLENASTLLGSDLKVNIEISNETVEEATAKITDTDKILVVLASDDEEYIIAKIISNDTIDNICYNTLVQALTLTKTSIAMTLTNIDVSLLNKVVAPINIERVLLDDNASEDESMKLIMSTVFPTVIMPFFILVIFLVQMIGAEINEEKQTRSMEVIISNVSPKIHFFSKVLSANVFVIFQGLLLILYAFVGLVIRFNVSSGGVSNEITSGINSVIDMLNTTGFMDKLAFIIPLTIVLMILSFIAYSLVAGILASMTVNMEDFQQIQTPIMFVSLGGYYLAIMSAMFKGSILIKILSYVPFISCLLSPALLVIGEIGIVDVIISILLLCFFIYILVRYGLKIYKIGILNYSTDKMWSKLFRAAKTKDFN